jgi:hypothetical protein
MTCEIKVEKPKQRTERHVTTIAGPQAAAILSINDGCHRHWWKDKSVDGLVELWTEITFDEQQMGKYLISSRSTLNRTYNLNLAEPVMHI